MFETGLAIFMFMTMSISTSTSQNLSTHVYKAQMCNLKGQKAIFDLIKVRVRCEVIKDAKERK